jgi:hypothetical protein
LGPSSERAQLPAPIHGCGLPEPVDTSADPELKAERGEGLKAGFLLLLEKLSPTERAAYILREAFDYTYRDVANALGLDEDNSSSMELASGVAEHVRVLYTGGSEKFAARRIFRRRRGNNWVTCPRYLFPRRRLWMLERAGFR